jgi:N-acetylglucosamine-6-sulfatase
MRQGRIPTRNHALVAALIVCAVIAAIAAAGGSSASGASPKPNIVLVVTDDQTVSDLYARGGRGAHGPRVMPETLRLIAGAGVTFGRAYSSNPISCPSRSTILTGQYSFNHGIFANVFPDGGFCSAPGRLDLNRSLPVWLQARGYRTLHYGRFLNGWGNGNESLIPPGWDEWVTSVDTPESPAALYYGYHLNQDGAISSKFGRVGRLDPDNYFTDVITSKAVAELDDFNPAQPFYLQLDERAPHEDLVNPIGPEPALRDAKALRHQLPPRPPSFNEVNTSDKAPFLRHSHRLNHRQIRSIKHRNRRRLQSLLAVDDSVERLMAELQHLGELDDTYVIFMSDNGFLRGEHRFIKGKRRPYEPSTRIPILIRGPGIPAGKLSRELVANVDIAPTIVDLAGANPTRTLDGRSMIPFARDPDHRSARPILLESYFGHFGFGNYEPVRAEGAGAKASRQPTPKTWKAIVIGRWKLIRYSKGVYELYDLHRDSDELTSLAHRRAYRPLLRFLSARLKALSHCEGASCREQIPKLPKPRP